MTDIFDGFHAMVATFRRADINAPATILLKTALDGDNLLACVRNQYVMPSPSFGPRWIDSPDGTVWKEVHVLGIRVIWPANTLAERAVER